jgi:putative SOS response-associated peptidase YedK
MCANYGFNEVLSWSTLAELAGLMATASALNLPLHEQFFPGAMAPVVLNGGKGRIARRMYWGLVPGFWNKPLEQKRFPTFNYNSRAPDWLDKPSFHDAIRHRRCIIPATYFIEYTGPQGAKQAVSFGRPDGAPFAMAGVWSKWQGIHKGEAVRMNSFSMLTTSANAIVQPVHPKAMPVVLDWADIGLWMEGPFEEAVKLARPCADDALVRL